MRRAVFLCLVVLCGCPKSVRGQDPTTGGQSKAKASPEADEALAKAIQTVDTASKEDGVAALMSVNKQFPGTVAGQEALYRAGVIAFENGEFELAKQRMGALVFENPLHPKANDAKLKLGLAAVELKAYRDAYQTLQPLVEQLDGEDRRLAEDALAKASAGTQQYGEALQRGLKSLDGASSEADKKAALARLEEIIETKTSFVALAETWTDLPKSNPAWPLLTFKMARVYFHLRDWQHLDETLRALTQDAPDSPYTAEAKAMQARVARRAQVKKNVVGAILPLSGKLKPVGEAVQRALKIAFEGSDVELIIKDSTSDATLAAKQVEQLALDEGVMAIIGPVSADETSRAALVAEELQVPLITLTRAEGVTKVGQHVFRTMVTDSQQAEALVKYTTETLGFSKFAVLYPSISYGKEMTNAFWDSVEKHGGQIRGAESYGYDQTSFKNEAKKLVGRFYLEDRGDYYEKVREAREGATDDDRLRRKAMEKARDAVDPIIDFEALLIPDAWQKVALVAPALAVEEVVTNACDRHDLERIQKTTGKNRKTVLLLGPATWSSPKGKSGDPELLERGQKYVQCGVYVDGFYENSERAQSKAFVSAFREKSHDADITLVDAVAYDTGGIVRHVLEKTAPTSRASMRESLAKLKGYEGATGTLGFDADRETARQLFLLTLTPRGLREIAPGAPAKKSQPEG